MKSLAVHCQLYNRMKLEMHNIRILYRPSTMMEAGYSLAETKIFQSWNL